MGDPGCITIHFRDIGTGFLWQSDSMDDGFSDNLQLEVIYLEIMESVHGGYHGDGHL